MEQIKKYFPDLTSTQIAQFEAMRDLYVIWNERINVISRKDIDSLYTKHVLHSLAIAKVATFNSGARLLDVGCGGGFPGIPLAVLFPEAEFVMVDSIGKKIRVVTEVSQALGLTNVDARHARAESVHQKFDFILSRAVTEMSAFVPWVWDKIERGNSAGSLANGILYLKGGDLDEELRQAGKPYALYDISDTFDDPFFETKKVVYIPK